MHELPGSDTLTHERMTVKIDVETLSTDFPILVGVSDGDVMHTEMRLGNPVAVVDTWEFGGQWAQYSDDNPLLVFDTATWASLSETAKNFVVAHEAHERDLAREAGDIGTDSPSEIVDRHHDAANRRAVADVGEAAATTYALETYARTGDCTQATHVLRGMEHLVPDQIRIER